MVLKKKAYYFLIGLFYCHCVFGQDQKVADSLKIIYLQESLTGTEKLELLRNISFNELNDINLSLSYAEELISESKRLDQKQYLYRGYLQKGINYNRLGDLQQALNSFFKSADVAIEIDFQGGLGSAYMSIADVYSVMENYSNADEYYKKAIETLRNTDENIALASALLNAGDNSFSKKDYEQALLYFNESGEIFKNENYLAGIAYNKGNLGMVYAEIGNHDLAVRNINDAVTILEELEDYYPICDYLNYMADIYVEKQDYNSALDYAHRSLELAQHYRLKEQIRDANLKLSEIYELLGNTNSAFDFYKNFVVYRDSIKNLENIEAMADQRTNHEISQKQIEVDLLEQKRKNQKIVMYSTLLVLLSIGVIAVGLFKRNKYIKATNKIIESEKQLSDSLLLNILPEETAQELKLNGRVEAKKFESVTVLFTDFKSFSTYSEFLTPETLVKSVDFYFSKFDAIVEKYDLEKIKTIGDAYMCAGGLPFPTTDHANKMVQAAMEIAEFVNEQKRLNPESSTHFDIRIGIHTGPVVAGVVGSKKFAYDIWGDTVNIASRMESSSEVGKINISEVTYELVKDEFHCKYRGEIEVKNRGKLNMYFVEDFKGKL